MAVQAVMEDTDSEKLADALRGDDEDPELNAWHACALRKETLSSHILDEIALEGLDGITLQALQVRLRNRPGFPLQMTAKSLVQIWNVILKLRDVEMYELPEAREDLLVYDRNDFTDERGCLYEPLSAPEDIYVYKPVEKDHIRGSCQHFETRTLVKQARQMTVDDAIAKYGNKLVLVASQQVREAAMLERSSEGSGNLTLIQFCMLERIARARYEGELTRGKVSLNTMKIDPKSLFYYRKYLIRKRMIMKQVFGMKFGENRANSLVSVLHIPRFYKAMTPVPVSYAKRVAIHLLGKPGFRDESVNIKRIFGKVIHKYITSPDFKDLFKEEDTTLAELHPDVFANERYEKKRNSMLTRTQKSVVFLNPPGEIQQYLSKVSEPDTKGKEPKSEKNTFLWGVPCNLNANLFDTPMHQTQELVSCGGTNGVNLMQIQGILRLRSLSARSGGRLALRLKVAKQVVVERKKTKCHHYVSTVSFPIPDRVIQKYAAKLKEEEEAIMIWTRKKAEKVAKRLKVEMKSKKSSASDGIACTSHEVLDASNEYGKSNIQDEFITPEIDSENVRITYVCPMKSKKRKAEKDVVEEVCITADAPKIKRKKPLPQVIERDPRKRLARLMVGRKPESKIIKKYTPKKKIKIMSVENLYYDDKDIEALARKNRLRVKWQSVEDKMILLLHISSVVFIPKYNLKKLFIFNAPQLRDLLHTRNEHSRSKTSLAIRRRLHFLMRNSVFQLQYRRYLMDAITDQFIRTQVVEPFLRKSEDPRRIFHQIPTELILQVFDYLVDKHNLDFQKVGFGAYSPGVCSFNARSIRLKGRTADAGFASSGTDGFQIEEMQSYFCDEYGEMQDVIVDGTKDPQSSKEIEVWMARTVMMSLLFCGSDVEDAELLLSIVGNEILKSVSQHMRRQNICTLLRVNRKLGISTNMRKKLSYHLHPELYKTSKRFLSESRRRFKATVPAVTTSLAALYSVIDHLMEQKAKFSIQINADYVTQNWNSTTRLFSAANPSRLRKHKPAEDDSATVKLPKLMAKIEQLNIQFPRLAESSNYFRNQFMVLIGPKRNDSPAKYALLYDVVHRSGISGISLKELRDMFTTSSLKNGIIYLLEEKFVFVVGTANRKFVSRDFVEDWTIELKSSNCRAIMYPWIASSGLINWDLLDWFFTSIIGILTRHPGIHVSRMIKLLNPVLSAVELIALLQALFFFGFITTYAVITEDSVGLSSRRQDLIIDPVEDPFLEMEDLHVELNMYSHTKYCSLQHSLNSQATRPPKPSGTQSEGLGMSSGRPKRLRQTAGATQ